MPPSFFISMAHHSTASIRSSEGSGLGGFYDDWLARLEELAKDGSIGAGGERDLIDRTLGHHRRYFQERDTAAGDDVFVVLDSPWLSSVERVCLWIGGVKPALILKLVESGVGPGGMSPEQARQLEGIAAETGRAERVLSGAMAAVQESVAAPAPAEVARQEARRRRGPVDGEVTRMEEATEGLKAAMAGVVEGADALRGTTMGRVMEVLRPRQAVKFLTAAAEYQLRIWRWGMQLDAEREGESQNGGHQPPVTSSNSRAHFDQLP